MDIHNIDDYLDLQDQHQMNLLSTEGITSQPEGETEWHSAAVVDNNNNNSSSSTHALGLDDSYMYNNNNNNNEPNTTTDWGLLQNQLDALQGINFIGDGGIIVSNNNSNECITPDSIFIQPTVTTTTVEPNAEEEEKRVTRSKGRANSTTTTVVTTPKKKKTRAKKLYCTCQQPYNGKPMVQCDYCSEWYHCACVGFDPEDDENEENIDWACQKCIEDQKVEKKPSTPEPSVPKTTETPQPKITITVPARQTRSNRTQSRCLYTGCTNRTRADSYCSDVCARKDKESSVVSQGETKKQEEPVKTSRKSRMKTAAVSAGTTTADEKPTARPTRGTTRRKSMEDKQDSEYIKEADDEAEASEKEEEDDDEEEEEQEESAATTPDTPMSPSQMTEQENPVRRNVIKNLSAILKTIIDTALAEKSDLFEGEEEMDPIARAETLAKKIENTMLEQLGDGQGKKQRTCGEPYKSKFRSLLYNLKDKQNQVFQMRVITGDLGPLELVKMSSEDMANPELKSMSEVFRKTGLKNSVMKLDNTPIIKKTHKGDIIMVPSKDNDTHQTIYAEQMESNPPVPPPITTATTTTPSEESTFSPTITTTTPSADGSKVDPLDDILARIGIPTQDDYTSNKRGSLDTTGTEYTKKRKVTLDMEELLGDEEEEFRVEEVDTTELEKEKEEEEENAKETAQQTLKEEQEDALPKIWHGRVNMPQVAEFEASARQIGGRILNEAEWEEVLSPTMWIEGRIPSDRVTSYVTQNQYSTSREIVLLEIEPANAATTTNSGGDGSQTLLKYLDSRKRYAVVGHNKTIVKDFYLIPLYKTQDIPDCLYVVRVEERKRTCDLFLGVLVISKGLSIAKPSSSSSSLPLPMAHQPGYTAPPPPSQPHPLPSQPISHYAPQQQQQQQQPQYGYGYAAAQSYNHTNSYQPSSYQPSSYQQQQPHQHQPRQHSRFAPYPTSGQQQQGHRNRNNNNNSSYGYNRPSY